MGKCLITLLSDLIDYLFRQIYRLPNLFFQHVNGTWLNAPLEFNPQLYEILIDNDLKRITTPLYRLSKAYSYLYSHPLSMNDRDYLEKLLLTVHNQQSKISFFHSFPPRVSVLCRFD